MCGRFGLIQNPEEVEELFGLADVEDFPPRYNIAPTQPILMALAGRRGPAGSNLPERRSQLVRWGLIPGWAKDPKSLPLLINARADSVIEKAAFRAGMRYRRSLVPASGFFEWRRQGKTSQPYWVRPRDKGMVAFAGVMEPYLSVDGSEIDTGAIITTSANDDVKFIHDRMPVAIKPQDFARWLDCRTFEPKDVTDLMRPADPGHFEAIPVSNRVNSHLNVGPENIQPIELADQSQPAKAESRPLTDEAGDGQLKLL